MKICSIRKPHTYVMIIRRGTNRLDQTQTHGLILISHFSPNPNPSHRKEAVAAVGLAGDGAVATFNTPGPQLVLSWSAVSSVCARGIGTK
ncbi:hypothetical protein E2562_034124 [Oryza meyeriana var. granulata]|uniref:Uncharacterized protein n=1 Tax=Oryza meyeriana var. granulata TaxID=110450 RepID=A0A6G1E595_9ORYZ|nr:hypothetical protein E2562_034124 [Oryza meyeriana var. granulata]